MDDNLFLKVCRRALREAEIKSRRRILELRIGGAEEWFLKSVEQDYAEYKEAIDMLDKKLKESEG